MHRVSGEGIGAYTRAVKKKAARQHNRNTRYIPGDEEDQPNEVSLSGPYLKMRGGRFMSGGKRKKSFRRRKKKGRRTRGGLLMSGGGARMSGGRYMRGGLRMAGGNVFAKQQTPVLLRARTNAKLTPANELVTNRSGYQ